MTHVRISRYVECPFSAAIEFAEKAAERRNTLHLTPAPPFGETARLSARTADDVTDESRKHEALLVAWKPRHAGLFPEFHGVLTVRPIRRGVCLQLSGDYEPPGGAAGKVFDAAVGRTAARLTLRTLLDDLASDIEREYERERSVAGQR